MAGLIENEDSFIFDIINIFSIPFLKSYIKNNKGSFIQILLYGPLLLFNILFFLLPGAVIFLPIILASLIIFSLLVLVIYEMEEYLENSRIGKILSYAIYFFIITLINFSIIIISTQFIYFIYGSNWVDSINVNKNMYI
jgi:hypothetical protein